MSRRSVPTAVLALLIALPAAALAASPILQATMVLDHYVNPFNFNAGETSIGVNPRTNNVFFQLTGRTMRAHFDDSTVPATPTWIDVTPDGYVATFDPLGFTDRDSGKTYVIHLLIAASQMFMTTDLPEQDTTHFGDGEGGFWIATQPPTSFPFFDHQTVGGGPHAIPPGLLGNPNAENMNPSDLTPDVADGALNALYYCGQLGTIVCARSDDDGLTWGPYLPIAQGTCGGLHGHIRADSHGVIYLPNKNCGGNGQAVHVSYDNGHTWFVRYIPGTTATATDPTVSVATDDTVYMGMRVNGRPLFSKSTDHGKTWSTAANTDPTGTIVNTAFPNMVAGDGDRAAFAFYGSTTPGDYQSADYTGVWHLYVSYTLDGGATWTMVDTTPNDPVQRGCIWFGGGNNACRNLLDFQDAILDNQGRLLVGYADGCVSAKCIGPTGVPGDSRASRGVIARETSGPRLLAAFD